MWLYNTGYTVALPVPIVTLFLFPFLCLFEATNIQSEVIELNDKFLQAKDEGLWFVDVCIGVIFCSLSVVLYAISTELYYCQLWVGHSYPNRTHRQLFFVFVRRRNAWLGLSLLGNFVLGFAMLPLVRDTQALTLACSDVYRKYFGRLKRTVRKSFEHREVLDIVYRFFQFYAPWCAHCKRLMPIWEHVGHALADRQSPVRVAKLDCTRFTSTASALNIRGYPTIIFFRNGKEMVYEGERKKDAMIDFAVKASGPVVGIIEDVRELSQLRRNAKEPFFVYVEGISDGSGNAVLDFFDRYKDIAEMLFSTTRFYRAKRDVFPKAVSIPETASVLVFKDNSYQIYKREQGGRSLFEWIHSERWPLLPFVTSTNIKEVGRMRILVLAVVNLVERRNETTHVGKFFSVVTRAAQTVRNDPYLSSIFQFGWLDGNGIANNIVLGTVNQPGLLIFNVTSYEYYLSNDATNVMTEKSIVSFLERIAAGDVPPLGGRSISQRIKRMIYEFFTSVAEMFRAQPLLTLCLFGVPLSFLSLITYCICSTDFSVDRDEIYPDDDDDSFVSDDENHQKEE